MSSSLFDNTRNFSFYAIPAAWVLCASPHWYAVLGAGKKRFDIKAPRGFVAALHDDPTLDARTRGRIIRAEGAQQNGFENLGLFAAAVVAGNYARLDHRTLNTLSGAYLLSRALYNLIYINNEDDNMAVARTFSFLGGVGLIFSFFIKSGNKLRNAL